MRRSFMEEAILLYPCSTCKLLCHAVCQDHLLDGRGSATNVDSARQNLAATFVNAFVNAGFGQDKLMTVPSEASGGCSSTSWLFKNKDLGKASAAASLGMILLWDVDTGIAQIDKYFHSTDTHVIMGALLAVGIVNCTVNNECDPAAIISLGLIGAGTINARIAWMLRSLSSYYYKDANLLFCVRIAQGLVHLGKGLLTLSPHHSERFLSSPTLLAGLLVVLHACLDMKDVILGKYHYILYFLALAMKPRMLMTVDENLKHLSVPVRVGQAVDVGQAGRPKTITGFQTHSTPVLLSADIFHCLPFLKDFSY